tara:strand:- start:205 stop:576 length:372 start_codon:yes stop_codon:yes gene_type:complete
MEIKTEINENELKSLQINLKNNEIILIKFTADWCGPCKAIKHICDEYKEKMNNNVHYYEIDIDESLELYVKLKSLKQVNGIPAILCFHENKERDYWYCPDDSCLGGNKQNVINFYERCIKKIS